jgi:hypothetical protein
MGFEAYDLESISLNALRASFLPNNRKREMEAAFRQEFRELRDRFVSDRALEQAHEAA